MLFIIIDWRDACGRHSSMQCTWLWRGRGCRLHNVSDTESLSSDVLARQHGPRRQESDGARGTARCSHGLCTDTWGYAGHCWTRYVWTYSNSSSSSSCVKASGDGGKLPFSSINFRLSENFLLAHQKMQKNGTEDFILSELLGKSLILSTYNLLCCRYAALSCL